MSEAHRALVEHAASAPKLARSYVPDPHRLLPQSPDAEKGVLSSCMIAPRDVIPYCVEKGLKPTHFSIPRHGLIFEMLVLMHDKLEPIDFITLTEWATKHGRLEECGGAPYITDLFTFLPTAANAATYVELLEEKQTLREIIRVSTEFASKGYEEQENPLGLLDEFEQAAMSIRQMKRKKAQTMKSVVIEVMGDLEHAHMNPGQLGGLSTGFADVDKVWDGMKPEEMIVIGARPSCGKTALSMNIVEHVAIDLGLGVTVFSLEMSTKALVQRMIMSRARVNYFKYRDGFCSERDYAAISVAASHISQSKIFIEDQSAQYIQEMRAVARRHKDEHDIQLVVIDYLTLARSNTKQAQEHRHREVSEVSAGCKNMAKELGIPVIVLAQLDRAVDKQQRRPRLSDLRESGSIEQDADKVAFLHRDALYAESEEERIELAGIANMIVAKHRNGPVGDIPLTFLHEYSRFETRGREQPDVQPGLNI